MRRKPSKKPKKAITLNLPERLREIADEWAGSNEQSLSARIEYLLRRDLEQNGVNPNLPADVFIKLLGKKLNLTPEQMEELRANHAPARTGEVVGELPA